MKTLLLTLTLTLIFMLATSLISMLWGAGHKLKVMETLQKTDFRKWRGQIDVLTGGFPHQPFSERGKADTGELQVPRS